MEVLHGGKYVPICVLNRSGGGYQPSIKEELVAKTSAKNKPKQHTESECTDIRNESCERETACNMPV